jgi:predicted glycosyltransferase
MRLLAEFSHPAQVHKFKHVLTRMRARGAAVLVLSRDKDVMLPLLDELGIDHVCISRARSGYAGSFCELATREWRTFLAILRFRPTLLLSAHSVAITHVGWLMGIPCIVHEDTEFGTFQQRLYMPFAWRIVTSTAYFKDWGPRQVRIDSLEPLAYLHPDQFRPDANVLAKYGLSPETPYVVLRLITWRALHDRAISGLSDEEVVRAVGAMETAGARKIVLSLERGHADPLGADGATPAGAEVVTPAPNDLHHLLAFARLCFSESITVANEAAVLGVPTILLNPLEAGHTRALERCGLVERILDVEAAVARACALLADPCVARERQQARARLLADKPSFTDALETLLLESDQGAGRGA